MSGWTDSAIGLLVGFVAVGLLACFSGGIFPALCHMGISPRKMRQPGVAVAWMYFCNIVGATLGSLLTGLVLLDVFTLQQNMAITYGIILIPLIAVSFTASTLSPPVRVLAVGGTVLAMWFLPPLYGHLYEHLQGLKTAESFK